MNLKPMDSLCEILTSIGILYELSEGEFKYHDTKQCSIDILDSQGVTPLVSFYFNIDRDGNQKFICQE